MRYYKVDVEMTNGFKYSYTCNGRMLSGMKQASTCWWTKSIESQEISEKEHIEFNQATFEVDKKSDEILRKAIKRSSKVVHPGKLKSDSATNQTVNKSESDKTKKPTKLDSDSATTSETKRKPRMASLEDFFGDDDDRTDRPSIPTKKTSRNQKADTVKKVRARRST